MTKAQREIYKEFDIVENAVKDGTIVIDDAVQEMQQIIYRYENEQCTAFVNSVNFNDYVFSKRETYHNMFLRLAKLTR